MFNRIVYDRSRSAVNINRKESVGMAPRFAIRSRVGDTAENSDAHCGNESAENPVHAFPWTACTRLAELRVRSRLRF